jgi:hypothetical protein
LAEPGRFDGGRRIVLNVALDEGKPEKVSDRDEVARDRAAIEAPSVERSQEVDDVASSYVPCGETALGCKRSEFGNVAPVGLDGIVRQALFDPQAIQECPNLSFHVQALSYISNTCRDVRARPEGTKKRRAAR